MLPFYEFLYYKKYSWTSLKTNRIILIRLTIMYIVILISQSYQINSMIKYIKKNGDVNYENYYRKIDTEF